MATSINAPKERVFDFAVIRPPQLADACAPSAPALRYHATDQLPLHREMLALPDAEAARTMARAALAAMDMVLSVELVQRLIALYVRLQERACVLPRGDDASLEEVVVEILGASAQALAPSQQVGARTCPNANPSSRRSERPAS